MYILYSTQERQMGKSTWYNPLLKGLKQCLLHHPFLIHFNPLIAIKYIVDFSTIHVIGM
jgi:hypothetical protein